MEKNYNITTYNCFWGETISKAMLVKEDLTAIANFLVSAPIFVDIIT
jgi:hypothetical protein